MGDVALNKAKQKREKVLSIYNNNGKNNHNNKRKMCSSLHNKNGTSVKTKNSNIINNELINLNGISDDNIISNISSDTITSSSISGLDYKNGLNDVSTKLSSLQKTTNDDGKSKNSFKIKSMTADMECKDNNEENSDSDSTLSTMKACSPISKISSLSTTPEALRPTPEPPVVSNEH